MYTRARTTSIDFYWHIYDLYSIEF